MGGILFRAGVESCVVGKWKLVDSVWGWELVRVRLFSVNGLTGPVQLGSVVLPWFPSPTR